MNIRKHWSLVALVLIFAAGIAMRQLAPTPVQAAGGPTVIGTVSVSNFPATQPVSGTVSVGNFPAFPATQNVNVTNAAPLPVTAADNPALQPYTELSTTFAFGSCPLTVPAGKRFVIETLSAGVTIDPGLKPLIGLAYCSAGNVGLYSLPAALQVSGATGLAGDVFMASQPVQLYADNSSCGVSPAVQIAASGSTTISVFNTVLLSGHLVNVP